MVQEQYTMGEKQRTPPYVDYHAFMVFLDEAKAKPPERVIDKKYLEQTKIAQGAHRMLLVSLRSLGLINSEGKPTLLLTSLLKEGDEFIANLQKLARSVYSDLLDKQNLKSLRRSDISKYFQNTYGVSPSTALSCASFFERLARDAKLLPSKGRKARRTGTQTKVDISGRVNVLSVKAELLRKLPDFKDGWQPAEVQAVLREFEKLLSRLDE